MPHVTSKSAEGTIEYEGIRYTWSEQGWFVLGRYSKAPSEVEEHLNSIARQLNRDDPYRWQNVLRFVLRAVLLAVPAFYALIGIWFPVSFDLNTAGIDWGESFWFQVLWGGIVFANASVSFVFARLKEPGHPRSRFLKNVGQIGGIVILNLIFVALAYWVTLWIFAAVNQRWQELRNWEAFWLPCLFSIPLIVVSMLVNWLLKHKSRWL